MARNLLNFDRNELLETITKEFPQGYGAEIGTFKGDFSKHILSIWNGTLYMVDVWRSLPSDEYMDISNHGWTSTPIFQRTIENIKNFEDRGIMVRATSKVASKLVQNNSLDFVYIDANHAYDYVVEDIELWYPKVKRGGYLCGHDYITNFNWYDDPNFLENKKDKHIWGGGNYYGVFGVNPAVDEFCTKNNYELSVTNEWSGSWIIKKR
jgi:Methyltransferase domain